MSCIVIAKLPESVIVECPLRDVSDNNNHLKV